VSLYSAGRARRALFDTIGFRAISQVSSVLGYVVLVRALSEQTLGVFSLLYSVIPVIGTVASLGLDQVLKRFQPEYLQAGDTRGATWLVRMVTVARLVSSTAILALLLAAWNLVAPLFHLGGHRADFLLFSIVVLLYFQVALLQISLASHMLHRYSVGSVAVLSCCKLITYFALWHAGALNLRSAIGSDAAAYALAYLFLVVMHRRLCRPEADAPPYRPSVEQSRRLGRFAIASNFSDSGSLLLYTQTDNLFVGALMSPAAVGTYAFYARLNEMTANLVPIRLFENVVQPLLFAVRRDEAAEKLPRYFTLLVNINLLLQFPLIAFTIAYHREIVQSAFGGKFVEYSAVLPLVISLAVSSNVFALPITMIAQYAEKASLILRSQLFGIYQVAAMLLLIPVAGLYGAVIATGTLHLFRNLYVWWHVRDLARWRNWAAVAGVAAPIWLVATLACLALKMLAHLPDLANMAIGAAVCAIAGVVHIRSEAISASDREVLAGVLHGKEVAPLRWLGMLPRQA